MWYDPRITLSHNCLFNFVVGARSAGKTFNSLLYAYRKWKKANDEGLEPWRVAYVRRYKDDIRAASSTLMSAIQSKGYMDGCEYKMKGKTGCIDGTPFVDFFPLSVAGKLKSVPYPHTNLIIFDEFLVEKTSSRYLTREVEQFLELYVTIARERDVPVLFLANAISQTNPYYSYFNIRPNGNEFVKVKNKDGSCDVLLHTWYDSEATERRKQSRLGRVIEGTLYSEYAIENQYWLDNDSFIEKRDAKSGLFFTFEFRNKRYSVWSNLAIGKLWVDSKLCPPCNFNYVFTREDMSANSLYAMAFKRSYHFKVCSLALSTGSMFFDNIQTKNIWYEIVRMCNI